MKFYDGVEGVLVKLYPDEATALAYLAKGKRVLEIGSLYGGSAIVMAGVAEHVVCVDPFNQTPTGVGDTLPVFRYNIRQHEVLHKVTTIVGYSNDVCPLLAHNQFDLVFIDADHREAPVTRDIEVTLPLLKAGGIMAFHDYDPKRYPGVVKAVERFRGERDMEVRNTLAAVYL